MSFTLVHGHATAMISSWMVFAPIGITFSRYGRSLKFGRRKQLLGKAVWFQCHRCLLSLTPLLTILGFLLIFTHMKGAWVDVNIAEKRRLAHALFGVSVFCMIIVQMWLALFRCHPNSRFRFIFTYSHRFFGFASYICAIVTIYLKLSTMQKNQRNNFVYMSSWTAVNLLIFIIHELIEYRLRLAQVLFNRANPRVETAENQEKTARAQRVDIENGPNTNVENQRLNCLKLVLLISQTVINVCFALLLILSIVL